MKKNFLEIGQIVGTHGIKGEAKVQPWCDSPQQLTSVKTLFLDADGKMPLGVTAARVHGNLVLTSFDGVFTVEQVQVLRGKTLYIAREDLKLGQNDWLIQDLIGCAAFDADSDELLGEICDVSQTGANDVWHIRRDGREYLVPAIRDVVISVDVDAGKIVLRPIKGIFDDEN